MICLDRCYTYIEIVILRTVPYRTLNNMLSGEWQDPYVNSARAGSHL
jgi:hypothetical protein